MSHRLIEDRRKIPPTAEEMTKFAMRFSRAEWEKLCEDKTFLDLIVSDLLTCKLFAERILNS